MLSKKSKVYINQLIQLADQIDNEDMQASIKQLAQSILKTEDLNLTDKYTSTALHYAVLLGNSEMIECFLQEMSEEAIAVRNCREYNVLHWAALYNKPETMKVLLNKEKLRDTFEETDLFGRTAYDIAKQYDFNTIQNIINEAGLPTVLPTKELKQLEVHQAKIINSLINYMTQKGETVEEIFDRLGICHGLAFLHAIYLSAGKEKEFYETLDIISNLKVPSNKIIVNLAQILIENANALLYRKKIDNKYNLNDEKRELLDLFISNVLLFQSSRIQQELGITDRIQQYELVKDFSLNRTIKNIVQFGETTQGGTNKVHMNKEQLQEMLEIFSSWPSAGIDISFNEHTVNLYISPEGKLKYYDPNLNHKVVDFNPWEIGKLAEHIYKFPIKSKDNLFADDTFKISFNVYKFYSNQELIPPVEKAHRRIQYADNSPCGFSPLHYAVIENNHEAINQCIRQDPKQIFAKDAFGSTPLLWAARMNNQKVIAQLLDNRALDPFNHYDENALLWIIRNDDVQNLKKMIKLYRLPFEKIFADLLPLAVHFNSSELMQYFIQEGERRINDLSKTKGTLPISKKDLDALLILTSKQEMGELLTTAYNKHVRLESESMNEEIEKPEEGKVSITSKQSEAYDKLFDAITFEEDELLPLLQNGALNQITEDEYRTLLAIASKEFSSILIKYKSAKKGLTTQYQDQKETPFSQLVQNDKPEAVFAYIERIKGYYTGNFFNYTSQIDHRGNTALHYIAESGNMTMWKIIENYKYQSKLMGNYNTEHIFDYTVRNAKGLTPIEVAVKNGHYTLVREMTKIYERLNMFSTEQLHDFIEKAKIKSEKNPSPRHL